MAALMISVQTVCNDKRTDIHSPSNLDPTAYRYLETAYFGPHASEVNIEGYTPSYARAIPSGNFAQKGTCDHCGTRFYYGVVFEHSNGDVIVVGHRCASESFALPSRAAHQRKRLEKAAKSARNNAKRAELKAAFVAENAGIVEDLAESHFILRDLRGKLDRFGSLSEKQVALARKIAGEVREKQQGEPAWSEVTEGKRSLSGRVLHTKWQDSRFGRGALKMLVQVPANAAPGEPAEKLWGSVPQTLLDTTNGYGSALKGKEVSFCASVERSSNNARFGIFKRPSKAKVVA